jgi:hypothetical protein
MNRAILILAWIMIQPDNIDRKMRMAKSVRLIYCRFVAKPSPFPGGLRGNRSKQTNQVGHNENCWNE